ncbi:MAG: hypothetical protein P1V36_01795 [Planctomycetota bacterium]|nr:hypothetical protein [Planctomycetota bacterium]
MRRVPPLPLIVFLLTLLPLRATGDEQDSRAAEAGRVAQLVNALEAHGAACHKGKLFRDRNTTYELLLSFEPDHAVARKWLKYKRGQDGTWTRAARYKAPRNLKSPAPEVAERFKALGDRFAEDTLAWLEAQGTRVPKRERARLLRTVARAAPHRADIHERRGEVLDASGAWLLNESLPSIRRRKELAEQAKNARARAPTPASVRPNRDEVATGVGWKGIVEGPRARIAGTVTASELKAAYELVDSTFRFWPAIYGSKPPALRELSVLLITSNAERGTLLKNHPRSSTAFQTFGASLSSGWFPKTNIVFARSGQRERRLEWCTRQPLAAMLRFGFKVRSKHGWAFEGFGLYVSHLLSGHRRTFYVRRTKYGDKTDPADDLWKRLTEPRADWRAHGRAMLASDRAPDLRLLLGKEVNTMNTEDMLLSYVLAAYLIEAHPERVPTVLQAVAAGTQADDLVEQTFELDVPGLALRLRRWLDETK